MAGWKDILDETRALGSPHDVVRRRYLAALHDLTGRNVILYYSGWLQKMDLARQGVSGFSVDDQDKNGFMAAIHGLDRSKGLDLMLHTPGGDIAAVESLMDYLRSMFDDIRAVVPQLAMSAGTIMALGAREIVMGKHSSLGPIDPQFGNIPAHGVVEEFKKAKEEIKNDPATIPVWQPIIGKYHPTFIGQCEKAIEWANEIAVELLTSGMLQPPAGSDQAAIDAAKAQAEVVVEKLTDNLVTKSHARHVSAKRAQEIGLNVTELEADPALQEAVLSVHHVTVQTLGETPAIKIIENQNGDAYITGARVGP